MNNSNHSHLPALHQRIFSVWYRHMRVYTKNLIANGLPPFLEPLIFLSAIGLGLGKYINAMNGVPYISFLAAGLLVTTAMFTASFECSFGTYIRLEFDKAYDGMLSAPITVNDLLIGEILWAGTKGFFFSLSVLIIVSAFGVLPIESSIAAPFIGFLTAIMFASISLFITSFVKDINQFNFYFTGFISPMFFFSGVVFTLDHFPKVIQYISEILPLTHSVRLVRAACHLSSGKYIFPDITYILLFSFFMSALAIKRLKKRLID